jgi:hypothetical protein
VLRRTKPRSPSRPRRAPRPVFPPKAEHYCRSGTPAIHAPSGSRLLDAPESLDQATELGKADVAQVARRKPIPQILAAGHVSQAAVRPRPRASPLRPILHRRGPPCATLFITAMLGYNTLEKIAERRGTTEIRASAPLCYSAGPDRTSSATLRGRNWPSFRSPEKAPPSTTILPSSMARLGQVARSQPSQQL